MTVSLRATSDRVMIEKMDLFSEFVVEPQQGLRAFSPSKRAISAADGGVTPLLRLAACVGWGVRSAHADCIGQVVVLRGPG